MPIPPEVVDSDNTPNPGTTKPTETTKTPSTTSKKTTSTTTPAVDNRKEKLINFFVELAVYNAKDKTYELYISRWTKPSVAVGVGEGTFDSTMNFCLNTYISDFNAVSSSVKLVRDDTVALGLPNVKIYY